MSSCSSSFVWIDWAFVFGGHLVAFPPLLVVIASVQIQIDELEEATTPNDAPEGGITNTESNDSETPLERICGLPEHIVDRELTANQERARFIAKDVRDYAEKAPAGFIIDSQTIKKLILPPKARSHTRRL